MNKYLKNMSRIISKYNLDLSVESYSTKICVLESPVLQCIILHSCW